MSRYGSSWPAAPWAELSCVLALGIVVGVRADLAAGPVFDDLGNCESGHLLRRHRRHLHLRSACRSPSASPSPPSAYIHFTTNIPLSVVISQMDQGMSSIELLAVPMFVVLGLLLEMTGIARAHGRFPRRPGRQPARRTVLRADRGDVPDLRHLGIQGGGPGRRGPGAAARDAAPRRARRRACRPACGQRRPCRRPSRPAWCSSSSAR